MTRLIDADALSEKLCETTIFIKDGEVLQRMINDAPTADAVEVVRCEDCKKQAYCHGTVAKTKRHTDFVEYWSEPIEWCSKGERKDGEE